MDQPIQVQEKAPQPQGLLPKNVQSWLLAGTGVSHGRDYVVDRGQEPQAPTKTTSVAVPPKPRSKSTKPRSPSCKAGSKNCSASSLWLKVRWRNRPTCWGRARPATSRNRTHRALHRPASQDSIRGRAEDTGLRFSLCVKCCTQLPYAPRRRLWHWKSVASSFSRTHYPGPDLPQIAQLLKDMQPNLNSAATGNPCPRRRETIPRKQRRKERRKAQILPPCCLALQTRRQEKPTCSLKEPFSKRSSSTGSKASFPVPSSACFQPMYIRTTANICSSRQARSCSARPKRWIPSARPV